VFASLTNHHIFSEGLLGQPLNLTPHVGKQNEVDKAISEILFPQLVEYNLSGDLSPSLAKSWEISDNGLEYCFYLADNIYWSNGRVVTADDVIFTAQNAPSIRNIDIKKINDFQVKFFLKEPFAPFLSVLTLKIIPKEATNGLDAVTLSTRQVARVVKSGRRVDEILVYVSDGPETGGKNIKFMAFKFYDRVLDIKTAAQLGEVDAFYADGFDNQRFFKVDIPLKGRRYGLFYNLEDDTLKDRSFRLKLSENINKDRIITEAFGGYAEPVDIPSIAFSEGSADSLSKKITLTVTNEESQLKSAAVISELWEKLGVRVTVLPLPFWDISTRVIDTKDFQVLLFGQEVARDLDEYTLWHSTKTSYPGLNISQLNNQRIDKALEDGRKEMEPEIRQEHYDNFNRILGEEIPAMFLYRPIYSWNVSKKFEDLVKTHCQEEACCEGCECPEFTTPDLYYPHERFKLLPI
jgi:peptide/nickel transport system substrate-binding protein